MIGRYFLLFLGLISLVWIGYVGIDLLDRKDQFSPAHIFGKEDGRVLIINKFNECSLDQLEFKPPVEALRLFNALIPNLKQTKSVLLSELQNQVLIERKDSWTKDKIISFFKKAQLSVRFEDRHSFVVGNFKGKFNHEMLFLGKDNIKEPVDTNDDWLGYDRKSSASIVTFTKNAFTISDIYIKPNKSIEYLSQQSKHHLGKQIDDQQLFADVLPNDLTDYHFYEKKYYSGIDKVFAKGPMCQWMEDGFVAFNYNDNQVIISDYIAGQDPLLLLNDLSGKTDGDGRDESGYFKNISLLKLFPEDEFYIKTMENFVVISSSQSACEQVIADYKLGNTLGLKKENLAAFYQDLPKKVTERKVSENEIYSRSIYRNKLLETRLMIDANESGEEATEIGEDEKQTAISLFVGEKIRHFIVMSGLGNVLAMTEEGSLQMFNAGKSGWKKNLNGTPVGEIQEIKVGGNEEKWYLCTTNNQVHCVNKRGDEMSGFPVKLESAPVREAVYYRWKGAGFIAVPSDKGELFIYDSTGKKVSTLKSGLAEITEKAEVWVSQGILLAAVRDEKQCVLFNLDKRKEYRRFTIDGKSFAYKTRNELRQFSLKNGLLSMIDQKGKRSNLGSFNSGKLLCLLNEREVPTIVLKMKNDIHLLNYQGKIYASLKLPCTEVSAVDVVNGPDGNSFIVLVDGLGNNVYLYNLNGKLITNNLLEGKDLARLNWVNSGKMIITTIVDDYIVQHNIN